MASTECTIKVVQYNVLSQRCAKNDERGFPHVDPKFLDEGVRAPKIAAEILALNADVVCLQEFDHSLDGRDSVLKRLLSPVYHLYGNSGKDAHGVCMAVNRKSPWEIHGLIAKRKYCVFYFEHQETGKRVVVSSSHFKAGVENSATRAFQTTKLLSQIACFSSWNSPVILCGDLNCEPSECAYQMLVQSKLGLESAYANEEQSTEHYTTRKMRAQEKCVCEDYILYTPSKVQLLEKRQLPPRESIPYPYLPNEQHGSDHLMLWCEFKML